MRDGIFSAHSMEKETKETQESKETVDETTTQDAPTEKENTDTSKVEADDSKNTEESESQEETRDYKAELEAAQTRTKKAEDKIVKMKLADKEDKQEETQDTTVDMDSLADKVAERIRGVNQEGEYKRSLESLSENPDKRNLINFHYENTIKHTGDLTQDLENAALLADKKTILARNSELSEALKARGGLSGAGIGSTYTEKKGLTPYDKLSQKEKDMLSKYNVDAKKYNANNS